MTSTFLGIDVGTSAVKAVLIDDDQRVLAQSSRPLQVSRPQPLWSEQKPSDWWNAVDAAVRSLRQGAPNDFAAVTALGLSGQMHGAVLLDRDGSVLRPAILWNDGRAYAECDTLQRAIPDLGRIAGVPAMPGFTAPKLLWVARHEPQTFARIHKVLLPKDYVRWRLSGEFITDCSDAAGTLWLDEARRVWSEAILQASGLSSAQMPRVVEGSAPGGTLCADIAHEWGLASTVVVAGGAGDAAAGAIGIGAINDGDAFVSLGTSAQYFVSTSTYRPYPEAFIHAFCHALPGRWFQMAAMLNGASPLAWIARLLRESDIDALLARVAAGYRGPRDVIFLPYLSGERTPHNDPYARGVFFGMNADTSAETLVQAVLDGVALSVAEAQDLFLQAGTRVERVAAIGGGSRSRFWMQILANALDRPVVLYGEGAQGPAFGAARLAQLAVTARSVEEVCSVPAVAEVIEPEPRLVDAYRAAGQKFRRLYRAVKNEFRS
jgi:xylulokinase